MAALRSERHFVGYDTDAGYVDAASRRIEEERGRIDSASEPSVTRRVVLPALPEVNNDGEPYQARAVREGRRAKEIALAVLKDCGFADIAEDRRFGSGVEVNFVAYDTRGGRWFFDVSGAFTTTRAGLRRTDTLWKALGKAAVLKSSSVGDYRLILLTTDLPPAGSAGDSALRLVRGDTYHDAIEMLSTEGQRRLGIYASGQHRNGPLDELHAPSDPASP